MTLYGSGHFDELVGSVGGTRIVAGAGNDVLTGGDGDDTLIGGSSRGATGSQSIIEIAGFGDEFKGVGAKFKVSVNGEVVGQGEAGAGHRENWDFDRFAFTFDTPAQFQTLEIAFVNDGGNAKKDRNLYITHVEVNGEKIDLSAADNRQEPGTGALYANGRFSVALGRLDGALKPDETDVDILIGGLGADRLTGGNDSDTFLYRAVEEIQGDVITDFRRGADQIDLSAIDADEGTAGDQAFTWVGNAGFTGSAGELSYAIAQKTTIVSGDIDGDGLADFSLRLSGKVELEATDFAH